MKIYAWSCAACGSRNEAGANSCVRCNCPAEATIRQIEQFRNAFITAAGALDPGAAILAKPVDLAFVAKLLLLPLGFMIGFSPKSRTRKK